MTVVAVSNVTASRESNRESAESDRETEQRYTIDRAGARCESASRVAVVGSSGMTAVRDSSKGRINGSSDSSRFRIASGPSSAPCERRSRTLY